MVRPNAGLELDRKSLVKPHMICKGWISIYENLLKGKQREKITFELPLSPMLMYSPLQVSLS
jgi:hypothetical protein